MAHKKLTDVLIEDFPFNIHRYSEVTEALDAAADGFTAIGHPDLARAAKTAGIAVLNLWTAIQAKERAELAEAAAQDEGEGEDWQAV